MNCRALWGVVVLCVTFAVLVAGILYARPRPPGSHDHSPAP
ncbi:hypothetical protein ACIQ7D_23710 [Streptomyces sp. NPDC096310]